MRTLRKTQRRSRLGQAFIGCAGLTILCSICALFGVLLDAGSQDKEVNALQRAAGTPSVFATEKATHTPTATPVLARVEPVVIPTAVQFPPTATSTATTVPVPRLTTEEHPTSTAPPTSPAAPRTVRQTASVSQSNATQSPTASIPTPSSEAQRGFTTPTPPRTPTLLTQPTQAPSPTPTIAISKAVARVKANLRAGPGLNYPVVEQVAAGTPLDVRARTPSGDWLLLGNGLWISADLVVNTPAVPVAEVTPTPPLRSAAPPAGVPSRGGTTSGQQTNPNAFNCIGGCAVPPDPSCAIKGNVNSKKEKIYHLPGQRDYNRTDIKPEEGDRWFCTEEEARAAGFRRALR